MRKPYSKVNSQGHRWERRKIRKRTSCGPKLAVDLKNLSKNDPSTEITRKYKAKVKLKTSIWFIIKTPSILKNHETSKSYMLLSKKSYSQQYSCSTIKPSFFGLDIYTWSTKLPRQKIQRAPPAATSITRT